MTHPIQEAERTLKRAAQKRAENDLRETTIKRGWLLLGVFWVLVVAAGFVLALGWTVL